jgi:biopolymer transport protein ExbD
MKISRGSLSSKTLAPLLDVLFILLFALLALSDTRSSEQPAHVLVRLPEVEPSTEAADPLGRRLVLVIDADSRIRLIETGEILDSRAELDSALSLVLGDAMPEEVAVEIQGDRDARHGVAVELLQHLRLRGFSLVSLVAQGSGSLDEAFQSTR